MTQPPLANNKSNPLRKSTEKSDEIISDHIVDEYEDDFEVDEKSNKKKGNAGGLFGNVSSQPVNEESSGGFEEKDNDDFLF